MNSKTPVKASPIQYLTYLNKVIVPRPSAGLASGITSIFIQPKWGDPFLVDSGLGKNCSRPLSHL